MGTWAAGRDVTGPLGDSPPFDDKIGAAPLPCVRVASPDPDLVHELRRHRTSPRGPVKYLTPCRPDTPTHHDPDQPTPSCLQMSEPSPYVKNAADYNWLSEEAKKNYTELPKSIKRLILLNYRLHYGHVPDPEDTAELALLIVTAFEWRWMRDWPIYKPERWVVDEIEPPADA